MQQLGRYEILGELGHGAMGTVYRARDPKIERVVAIKTVRVMGASPEEEAEYRRRFFREAQAAGKLSHPGIVTIYDVGEDQATQTPYIVMEFVEGRTLEGLLTSTGLEPPSLTASLELIKQCAEALDYAHVNDIVHRDIKPANIIINADNRAKIADFGIAKLTQSEFTLPGQILGTPAYISPELLKGGSIDGRSDLFALGVILYWMLTGQKPFTGDTATVLYQVVSQDPPPVTHHKSALPAALNAVVSRALAKDPALRYRRGRELAEDLDDVLHSRDPRWAGGSVSEADRTVVTGTRVTGAHAVGKTMVGQPASGSETAPPPAGASASPPPARFFHRVSMKARIAIGAGLLLALFLPFLFREGTLPIAGLGKPKTATLDIRSSHAFRSADLSIWVDGKLAHQGKLTGVVKKSWFRSTVRGSFSESLTVPAGKHVVRVRVRSAGEGYDQSREITADMAEDQAHRLVLGFSEKGRTLRLSLGE